MQFVFFYPKDNQKFFWKTIDFTENLDTTEIAKDEEGHVLYVIMTYDAMRAKIDMWFTT